MDGLDNKNCCLFVCFVLFVLFVCLLFRQRRRRQSDVVAGSRIGFPRSVYEDFVPSYFATRTGFLEFGHQHIPQSILERKKKILPVVRSYANCLSPQKEQIA
jgi:hypothetical protein